MRTLGFSCLALCLAGCATAPTDIGQINTASNVTADGADASPETDVLPEAMLIVAVGPIATGGNFQFQRLNGDRSDFAAKPENLAFGAWGVGDKLKRPKDEKSSVWVLDQTEINFLAKAVPAGDYAATYASWSTFNGYASGTAWRCMTDGAATFTLEPGSLTIVLSNNLFPPRTVSRLPPNTKSEAILGQFERTRTNYPNMQGEPVLIKPDLQTRWEDGKSGFFEAACSSAKEGTLSVNRLRVAGEEVEPDDADKAAIAAALSNLQNSTTSSQTEEGEE